METLTAVLYFSVMAQNCAAGIQDVISQALEQGQKISAAHKWEPLESYRCNELDSHFSTLDEAFAYLLPDEIRMQRSRLDSGRDFIQFFL